MRILIILLFLVSPFILIGQNISGTYENDSIVFINKIDSTQNFKADSKFKIEVSFNEEHKLNRGKFLIQNLEYPDEVVIFTITKPLWTESP